MQYRAEIDGLRALAVVPVVLFHAGFETFSGGYVGVDIFFVISGYLITTLLLQDLEAKRFSLVHFYERRARRILPALFCVMACCLPFAYAWMLPSQLVDFSHGLIAISTFVSNILFWSQQGYFAPTSDENPLLHTWSLAVEEQFYLFFPIGLWIIWRFGRRNTVVALWLIAILSLGLCEWGSRVMPSATFYWAPFRAWELLTGALCAFWLFNRPTHGHSGLAFAGLAGILLSIFLFDNATRFPSLLAFLPVGGTILIICFASGQTLLARALSVKPLVTLGLISYSLYLWHQPLFAFAKLRVSGDPAPVTMLLLILAALLLAMLSWRYVEQPFRIQRGLTHISTRAVWLFTFSGSVLLIGLGIIGHQAKGWPERFTDPTIMAIDDKLAFNLGLGRPCIETFTLDRQCRTAESPSIVLWGDSYAMHLVEGLKAADLDFWQHTRSGCAPFLGMPATRQPHGAEACMVFNQAVINWLETQNQIDTVILSGSFGRFLVPSHPLSLAFDGSLRQTIARIHAMDKSVLIVSPPPETGQDIGDCLKTKTLFGLNEDCHFKRDTFHPRYRAARQFLNSLNTEDDILWLEDIICNESVCRAEDGDIWIYRDGGHLTREGSIHLLNNHPQILRLK